MSMNQHQLIVKKGPNPGQAYPIFADRINIGRDPMSDIIFKDPEVSRKHLILTKSGSNYILQDLGSTNGTFIDGQRLQGNTIALQPGQEIALGGAITLIYKVDEELGNLAVDAHVPTTETPLPEFISSEEVIDHWADEPVALAETGALGETADDEDSDYGNYEEDNQQAHAPAIDQLQPLQRLSSAPAVPSSPPAQRYSPPPPPTTYGTQPLAPSNEKNENQRIMGIAIGVFIGLTIFCCVFLVFMYYIGGDWLLNQVNSVP
jgi:hypothetical protein